MARRAAEGTQRRQRESQSLKHLGFHCSQAYFNQKNEGVATITVISSCGGLGFLETSSFVVVSLNKKKKQNQKFQGGGED